MSAVAVLVAASLPALADDAPPASTVPAEDTSAAPLTSDGDDEAPPATEEPPPSEPETIPTTGETTAETTSGTTTETTSVDATDTTLPDTTTKTSAPETSIPEPVPADCAPQGTENVATDGFEYAAGSTVQITGTGYVSSCVARISITTAGSSAPFVVEVETSGDGQLAVDYVLDDVAGAYDVTVLGVDDVELASTTCTLTAEEPPPPPGCTALGSESVLTERSEYAPGATVHVFGGGYSAACDLRVQVTGPDGAAVDADARVAAEHVKSELSAEADDASITGGFSYDFTVGEVTGRYRVRVFGGGEVLAATTFAVRAAAPSACARRGAETVATDKADYAPGETVHMTGAGYAPSCLVRVKVIRPDGSVVKGDGSFTPGVDQVVTSTSGTVGYDYVLDGIEGLYRVRVLGAGGVVLASTTFTDQIRAAPSDSRATFFDGNAVECADVGFPDDIQVGAAGNGAASDGYVSGTVTVANPEALQVEITAAGVAAGVVIDAVMAKGSNGYNVYEPPFVPPDEAVPQNYIPPATNPDAPIAGFSHWFVCYHLDQPLEQGALLVLKRVVAPPGPPVEPLPTEYAVDVTCTFDGETVAEETVTFGPGGGVGSTPGGAVVITGLPVGTVCTVVEQGTAAFPDGTVVGYVPAGAPDPGVTIGEGPGAVVVVNNNFSDVETLTGSLQVTKVLIPPPPGVDLPDSFTVEVACSDGTITEVTVPAGGSATVEDITADAYCLVVERTASLPPEMDVSYSPSPLPERLSIVRAADNTTIEVTITNDASNIPATTTTTAPPTTTTTAPPTTTTTTAPTTTTCPSVPGEPPVTVTDPADCPAVGGGGDTTPPGGTLPVTGGGGPALAIGALLAVALGVLLTLLARRTNTAGRHLDN